jgi:hypothetical protein
VAAGRVHRRPYRLNNTNGHGQFKVDGNVQAHDPRRRSDTRCNRRGVAHLAVRVRDGDGLVGPLVMPGVTSCLGNP